nr:aminomethyltransferase family protein [Gluconacetobacter tumulisoli]
MLIDPAERVFFDRLVVAGGHHRFLGVRAGDRVEVVNRDGGQPGLLLAAPDMVSIDGTATDVPPSGGLADALADARAAWDRAIGGTAGGACVGHVLFADDAPEGATAVLHVARAGTLLLAAPGGRMEPGQNSPPTALDVTLHGAGPAGDRLPDPLAPPLEDVRVPAASARAFRVRKGDYIQIIDVAGRQCSDFLAFDAAALAEGEEFGLDATATRTVMGLAMPLPGLHAKFLDARLRPLVEVVQDTVGRHDAFLMACAPRYYEDAGYPGHANCTDNFNAALAGHGIAPRAAWPAINFFYNTNVAPCGTITMDEPWSRPGDYVLLRALTDLVCAASSCADDIDPANGWQPTDIHVRIYDGHHAFARGIAHRMTPDAPPVFSRETGFHTRTQALTARFVEYRGFWLPSSFDGYGPVAEYWACRERACVMDLSALRKFEIVGPDAEALMQYAVTRDMRKLAVGQVVYTAMCYPHGGMLDDGTVFRMGPQAFRWVCGDDFCGQWLRDLARARGLAATVRSSTDQLHNLAVQGPKSREILSGLIWTPPHQTALADLKWFRFTIGRIGDAQGIPVLVSRTGYTGELGYEIWCHPDHAPAVWDAVWAAGQPHGLAPIGLDALDWLRIEAGLVFAQYEFCSETDPFEAGIGFTVPAAKDEAYVGQDILRQRREAPRRRLVGLDVAGNETVGHGDPVYVGRARVGVVTSATRSPILKRTIALAQLDAGIATVGQAVEIGKLDGQQKRIAAQVAPFPAYDPQKTRVRS